MLGRNYGSRFWRGIYTYDRCGNVLTETFNGNSDSSDDEAVCTISQIPVTESAAQRLGQSFWGKE